MISTFIHNQHEMFPSISCVERDDGKSASWHLSFRESVTNNVSISFQFRTHDALAAFLRLIASAYSLAVENVNEKRLANDTASVADTVLDNEASSAC